MQPTNRASRIANKLPFLSLKAKEKVISLLTPPNTPPPDVLTHERLRTPIAGSFRGPSAASQALASPVSVRAEGQPIERTDVPPIPGDDSASCASPAPSPIDGGVSLGRPGRMSKNDAAAFDRAVSAQAARIPLTNKPLSVRRVAGDGAAGTQAFVLYSTQRDDLHVSLRVTDHQANGLWEAEDAKVSTHHTYVEIGGVEFGEHVFSADFASCTPVAACYADGSVALHHSSSFNPEDLGMLLDGPKGAPLEVFIIAREGEGTRYPRQSVNAVWMLNNIPKNINVHIMAVPKSSPIAVDFGPLGLDVWLYGT